MSKSIRRTGLIAAWTLGVALMVGCGEINGMLDAGAGKDEKSKAAAEQATSADTGAQSAQQKLDEYYKREPRKVVQDPNDPIVTCRLRGSDQFMRRTDCQLRGGTMD